jgi:3-hydroxy-9,10-secoandrosta-1,3,5(10)-triene-9,17-dione monooxygenase
MDDFHRLGFFKVVQPKRYGGYEMDPSIIFDLQLELGRGCASSAWVYGVLNVHTWQLALFAPEAQDEVWKDAPTTLISSSYMPVAKTEWVDGGVKLSGRWSFSSGCDYAEWAFLGGFVPTEEGKAQILRRFPTGQPWQRGQPVTRLSISVWSDPRPLGFDSRGRRRVWRAGRLS